MDYTWDMWPQQCQLQIYHLVLTNIAMENPPKKCRFIAGKIIYFYGPWLPWLCNKSPEGITCYAYGIIHSINGVLLVLLVLITGISGHDCTQQHVEIQPIQPTSCGKHDS